MNATAPIKRGSLYLTDDFIQALTYNVPGKISSFALLNLPNWGNHSNSMYVDPALLGLPAGTVDPNVIMPAVLSQYWLNLCAYARQAHAQQDYGEDIEDFSEQAFWKCLQRLLPAKSFEDLQSVIVAKSTDIMMNCNSVDGNMYMELLVSVNSLMKQQTVQFAEYKPIYLQTIQRLPSISKSKVVSGTSVALYDFGKTYYDITDTNCNIAKYTDDEEGSDTFNYNAILLFYKVGNVEQCAGIYFPNPFVTVGDDYVLTPVTKTTDVTQGYSINVRYMANGDYDYTANNADIGNAMQVYNAWYKAMTNANFQIQEMAKAVMKQGEEVERMKSMLDSGYLTTMHNKLLRMEQLLKTTFQGAVSTNQLLDMFVAAKNNQGKLDLTVLLSDMTKTIIGNDLHVSSPVGAYQAGDIIPTGTSVTEILQKMLSTGAIVNYVYPYGSLSINNHVDNFYVAYHYASPIAYTINLIQGNSGGFVFPTNLILYENGSMITIPVTQAATTISHTPEALTEPLIAELDVNYNEGEAISEETADERVFAGILNLRMRVVPVYTAYFGGIDNIEELANITGSDIVGPNFMSTPSNTLNPVIYNNAKAIQVLCIPADCDCPLTNQVIGNKAVTVTIGGLEMNYMAYAVQGNYLNIDTTNLR